MPPAQVQLWPPYHHIHMNQSVRLGKCMCPKTALSMSWGPLPLLAGQDQQRVQQLLCCMKSLAAVVAVVMVAAAELGVMAGVMGVVAVVRRNLPPPSLGNNHCEPCTLHHRSSCLIASTWKCCQGHTGHGRIQSQRAAGTVVAQAVAEMAAGMGATAARAVAVVAACPLQAVACVCRMLCSSHPQRRSRTFWRVR